MLVLYIKIVMVLRPLDIMVFKARKFVIIRRAGGGHGGLPTPLVISFGGLSPLFSGGACLPR